MKFQRLALSLVVVVLTGCQSYQPVRQSAPSAPKESSVPSTDRSSPLGAVAQLLGEAELEIGRENWSEAIRLAEQGLRLDRRSAGFYRVLAISYHQQGDEAGAREFARQAVRFCRDDCLRERRLMDSLREGD